MALMGAWPTGIETFPLVLSSAPCSPVLMALMGAVQVVQLTEKVVDRERTIRELQDRILTLALTLALVLIRDDRVAISIAITTALTLTCVCNQAPALALVPPEPMA